MLKDIDSAPASAEPDEKTIIHQAKELDKLAKEEPLDVLENAKVIVELSDDPVRLYLREIGEIDLLDVDRELWLATRLEAPRRIEVLNRGHPLARRSSEGQDGRSSPRAIYMALFVEMKTAWRRVVEDTRRLGFECPDLPLILSEAQMNDLRARMKRQREREHA